MEWENEGVQLSFTNYNYAFSHFYQSYTKLCEELATSSDIKKAFRLLYSFVSDFSYAIPSNQDKEYYLNYLVDAKLKLDQDKTLNELMSIQELRREDEVRLLKIYYAYYYEYLQVLASFLEKLTSTLMPSTTIQKKMIRFSNNQMFFEKLIEYKRKVLEELSGFSIFNFKTPFNYFITYYYAYRLFVIETDKVFIDECIELSLSKLLHKSTVDKLIRHPNLTDNEFSELRKTEGDIDKLLLFCNSVINDSFSKYGVFPKIQEKVYVDRCLI